MNPLPVFSATEKVESSTSAASCLIKTFKRALLFCLLLGVFTSSFAQQSGIDESGMKTYYLILLKKGPHRTQDSLTAARIQEQHLAHLTKMGETGKMDLAGPLLEDGDVRGICVYNVASAEEAKRLAEDDPAVKAGRLVVEIHPWYAMKGACLK